MAVAWLLRPFVLALTALFAFLPLSSSITESESLLKFKQSLPHAKSLDSWGQNSEPCGKNFRWFGLLCNKNSVFGLQLERMGLSGSIDVASLTGLPGLRTISIMNNSFTGAIPEFNRLKSLKTVYLSGNRFSGTIPPDYFANMASLKKVWLSNNEFSGPIPISLATGLPNLIEVHLENNKFNGPIPDFAQQSLVQVDFSNNQLTGEIPPGLSKFDTRFFAGNVGLCGQKLGTSCQHKTNSSSRIVTEGSMRNASKIKYVIAFGTLGGLILIVLASIVFRKTKKKISRANPRSDQNDGTRDHHVQVTVAGSRNDSDKPRVGRKGGTANKLTAGAELVMVNREKGVFGLPDLMNAAAEVLGGLSTGRTSSASRPSSGGNVGSTYKAVMGNGVAVVVKRVTVMNQMSKDVFDKEIRRLGSLRHKNLLTPLAYHFRQDEKLLISEFVPNLSLLHRLHEDHGELGLELDWPARRKIIQGIARGVEYLHRELGFLTLPHGNLKSSNVLLSSDGEPLISGFGYHRLINPEAQIQSLVAYRSPEVDRTGTVSAKSDVFCVGVVILEILTGKFPSQYAGLGRAGGTDIVEWVGSAAEHGGWMELLHPTVAAAADSDQTADEVERILRVGVRCTGEDPDQRPEMIEIVEETRTNKESKDEFITMT
ncbi:PREDICTED: pollen receptor-like kinase 3 [Tarenaya hassleriana]|uniref:pollen receptor-like kinase 3 n=1 Tax=Tarenaya hassleriana TaxID=28532 RepID=UPI00053C7B55|nr:PREDICTED: pollen receptor-like kinase 3 [Tarenaya hassleriana]